MGIDIIERFIKDNNKININNLSENEFSKYYSSISVDIVDFCNKFLLKEVAEKDIEKLFD